MERNISKIKSIIVYFIGITLLVSIDQLTKWLAVTNLKGKNPIVIISDIFELSYLQNSGAAWGMLQGRRVLFVIFTIIVLLIITYIFIKTPPTKKYFLLRIIIILLASGAIGNFIDRLINGYVHDFFYFKLINFPIFNVADVFVVISMILFIIAIFFVYNDSDFGYLSISKKKDGTNGKN